MLATTVAVGLAACGSDDTAAVDRSTPATTTAASGAAVDAAFTRQMIPHHELAIEMAKGAERHATHAEIKQLAKAVVAAQRKEIKDLEAFADTHGIDVVGSTAKMDADARAMGLSMDAMGMSMQAEQLDSADDFDRAFIDMMVTHHQGAVAMAKAELAHGSSDELKALARDIVTAQEREIADMRRWRAEWFGASDAGATTDSGHMDHSDMPGM
jgi:uncharacterized protein (DUF305 family)